MQMLPVSPSPPSSIDNDYVDISAVSNQIESLRIRLTPIIGNSVPHNRDTNVEKTQSKQPPRTNQFLLILFQFVFEILVSLSISPSPRRRTPNLFIPSVQTTPDLTR
jgi:hypothetical protein